jgi:hypothetical protein
LRLRHTLNLVNFMPAMPEPMEDRSRTSCGCPKGAVNLACLWVVRSDWDMHVAEWDMMEADPVDSARRSSLRICLLGATGTIGRATVRVLVRR